MEEGYYGKAISRKLIDVEAPPSIIETASSCALGVCVRRSLNIEHSGSEDDLSSLSSFWEFRTVTPVERHSAIGYQLFKVYVCNSM